MVVAVVLCSDRRFADHNDRDLTETGPCSMDRRRSFSPRLFMKPV
jgi:hypothetical protein